MQRSNFYPTGLATGAQEKHTRSDRQCLWTAKIVQILGRRHGGGKARAEAGVGEAPRHEVAGGGTRFCSGRYGFLRRALVADECGLAGSIPVADGIEWRFRPFSMVVIDV